MFEMPAVLPSNAAPQNDGVVHVVEDDVDLRDALACLLDSVGLPHRVYETSAALLDALPLTSGGCLVLDIRLPGLSGVELAKEVRARRVGLPIVMMSAHADVPVTIQSFKLGALDFLIKPFEPRQFLETVRQALARDQERRRRANQLDKQQARLAQLSPKDWEVIELLRAGHPNKRIAAMLGVSERAVEMRRSKMLKKTQTASLTALVELIALHPRES